MGALVRKQIRVRRNGKTVLQMRRVLVDSPKSRESLSVLATQWKNHAALNAGIAARDTRYMFNYPGANGKIASAKKRIPRLVADVVYGVIPPQLTHHDDLSELNHGTIVAWVRHGYNPWDHPQPVQPSFRLHPTRSR